ncbi:hypothetical protein AVEN_215226-1 [Araneus ventricosus]|uniref:Uncharacterized protein n=1 Tax=Araneus ventricosus TaxID=182803 RepID=A0A4Y2UIT7_ARAVE|nr:hypothetical protein AVEN_215226-1 [Araneus ventricosus]
MERQENPMGTGRRLQHNRTPHLPKMLLVLYSLISLSYASHNRLLFFPDGLLPETFLPERPFQCSITILFTTPSEEHQKSVRRDLTPVFR